MQPARVAEQLGAGEAGHPLVGEHERDRRRLLVQALQRGQRASPESQHSIRSRRVAALELRADPGESLGIVIGGEQDGEVPHGTTLAAAPVASLRTVP